MLKKYDFSCLNYLKENYKFKPKYVSHDLSYFLQGYIQVSNEAPKTNFCFVFDYGEISF